MDFSTKEIRPEAVKTDCVAVAVFSGGKLSPSAQRIDSASRGQLAKLLKKGDFDAKAGNSLMLYDLPGVTAPRVLLVGAGKSSKLAPKEFRDMVRATIRAVSDGAIAELTSCLGDCDVAGRDAPWSALQTAIGTLETVYRFSQPKSRNKPGAPGLKRVVVGASGKAAKELGAALKRGNAIGEGTNLARDLGNLPPNICTPTYLAEQARQLSRRGGMKVGVLGQREMQKLGMGALLAVAQGSRQPPKFIILEHRGGAKSQKPVVLVGKGITFDTGGISLKPSSEMDEMKYDMSGAGSVIGTMHAISAMKLPLNVVGLIPASENMPGGNATRPGDVVTSMSGQSIEILNTDAEGRLVLCDALTYAERFQPSAVIDIATLTGACVIALGNVATGLFSNDDQLADALLSAGQTSWDRVWRMPVWDDYQDQLNSNFADMANIGGRPAGSITAACFLERFARKFRWAHLDIAGTAWRSGKEKGSSGRPVPLLSQFLMSCAGW